MQIARGLCGDTLGNSLFPNTPNESAIAFEQMRACQPGKFQAGRLRRGDLQGQLLGDTLGVS